MEVVQKYQKTCFSKLECPSRFYILILNGAQNFKFHGFWYATLIGWIVYTFQDTSKIMSLEIKKKRGSSIDLDIHHSKVPIVDFFDSLPNPPFWKFLLGFDQWACDWILDSFLIKLNCSSFLIKLNCSSFLIKLNCSFSYLMLFFW